MPGTADVIKFGYELPVIRRITCSGEKQECLDEKERNVKQTHLHGRQ
jgi:hypothetical protein